VLPLYLALCLPDGGGGILQCQSHCQRLIDGGVARMWDSTRAEYQPTNADRPVNLEGLRDLFYAFPSFNSVTVYLDVVDDVRHVPWTWSCASRATRRLPSPWR
jgi:hypothetical protein